MDRLYGRLKRFLLPRVDYIIKLALREKVFVIKYFSFIFGRTSHFCTH